jgi:hypothetical protein
MAEMTTETAQRFFREEYERLRSIDQGGGFDSSSDEAQMLRDMVGYAAVAFGIVGWPYERRQK